MTQRTGATTAKWPVDAHAAAPGMDGSPKPPKGDATHTRLDAETRPPQSRTHLVVAGIEVSTDGRLHSLCLENGIDAELPVWVTR